MNDFRTPGEMSGSKICNSCGESIERWAIHCTHCGKACPTLIGAPSQSCGMLMDNRPMSAPAGRSSVSWTRHPMRAGIAIAGAITAFSFVGILMAARLAQPAPPPTCTMTAPPPAVQPIPPTTAATAPAAVDDSSDYCVEPPPVAYSVPESQVQVVTLGRAVSRPILPPSHPIVQVPTVRFHTPIPIRIILLRVPAQRSAQIARPSDAPSSRAQIGTAPPESPGPVQGAAVPSQTPGSTPQPPSPGSTPESTAPHTTALGTVQA